MRFSVPFIFEKETKISWIVVCFVYIQKMHYKHAIIWFGNSIKFQLKIVPFILVSSTRVKISRILPICLSLNQWWTQILSTANWKFITTNNSIDDSSVRQKKSIWIKKRESISFLLPLSMVCVSVKIWNENDFIVLWLNKTKSNK